MSDLALYVLHTPSVSEAYLYMGVTRSRVFPAEERSLPAADSPIISHQDIPSPTPEEDLEEDDEGILTTIRAGQRLCSYYSWSWMEIGESSAAGTARRVGPPPLGQPVRICDTWRRSRTPDV
ncbi:hypothetical protein Tco_1517042 [Tanacetum coccineum]